MTEYLQLVDEKKIDKSNALQYWLDKLPLFEKLYKEKYLPLTTHPNVNPKQGGGSTVQTGGANCNNLDFTTNNTNGWTGQWNNVSQGPGSQIYGGLAVNGFNSSLMDRWGYVHELCTGGVDRNVPINTVPPGHNIAMRLGNDSAYRIISANGNNVTSLPYNHQIISNTFLVTQLNKAVTYWYAVVLCQYNPNNHASNIQPYFKIRLYDQNGNEIMCAHYDVDALTAPTIGGFQTMNADFFDNQTQTWTPYDFFYKDWSQVMIPLQNYVGQNVTLTFETSDCAGGGHPGYAYVTADCAPMPNITITPFACGSSGSTATLTAPAGAGTYSWAGPGIVGSNSNQAVTVNAAGGYTVTMTTLGNSGFNCSFSVDTVIGPPPPAPTASFTAPPTCAGSPMQFTDQSNTMGATIVSCNWTFGDGTGSTAFNPTHVYGSGIAGQVPVNYTITTSTGCVATYSAMVTVYSPPLPLFSTNLVCVGNPTSFSNQTVGGISYSWNFGDGSALSTTTNPTHTYASSGTFTATLTATSANTCTLGISIPVIVKPQPVASGNAPITCLGSVTNFNNTSTFSGIATWSWNFGDPSTGADTSNVQNPTYTYPAAGIYTVSLGLTAGTGCAGSTTFTVLVSPLPAVSATQPPPYCPGASVPSPVLTSTPSTGVIYTWSNNNTAIGLGASGFGVPPPFIAGQNTTGTNLNGVITVVPSLNGCAGPPTTYTIQIQTAPVIVQPPVELCPNSVSAPINFATIPAGVAATFNWTNTTPGTNIGLTQQNGTGALPGFVTINPGSSTVYNIISVYASLNGCNGPPASFSITVNPYPQANFTHSRACEGNNTLFADASTISAGYIAQWNWDMDGDGLFDDASSQFPPYIFPTAGIYTVSLQVESNKGCRNVITHTLSVNPSPKVNIFVDDPDGCAIHTANFTDSTSVAPPQQIVSYQWYFGNGTSWANSGPVASSFPNVSHTNLAYYSVSLQVTSDSGCVGGVVKANMITVFPIPLAAFDWGPKDADVLDPTIHLYDQSVGASGPNAILWYLGDTHLSNNEDNYTTVQHPVHKYSELEPGIYHVTQWVENVYGCRDSITDNVVVKPTFTFYIPNAFTPGSDGNNDGFKGTGIGIDNSTYHLWIYDRWGELIWESHDLEESWNGMIKGQKVQEDVYVWKVEFNDTSSDFHQYKGIVNLIR